MSYRSPVRVTDLHHFDAVIDARTPAEFALDHVPGAINLPVLTDEERVIVGTLYKQVGAFEAKRVGGAMVAANLAKHLQTVLADKPAHWKPVVYCWRGGMRSGSMVTWLRMVGWDAHQLAGGYKAFRHHVVERIDALVPQLQLRVLCGATGSAKTQLLHALAQQGEQVLDLEGYARHKGSLLGGLPGVEQPSQKAFETALYAAMQALDVTRPVYIEGESAKIGRVALPVCLVQHMRAAALVEVQAEPAARLAFLLRDYAYLGDDVPQLCKRMSFLKEIQGAATIERWCTWAEQGALEPLFADLMALHYDPQYERSQAKHFTQWPQRLQVPAPDLSAQAIPALAQRIAALGGAAASRMSFA